MRKIIKDGHMHSPYCPHGSSDDFQMYIEKAINIGLKEISFTEHMPFPLYFMNNKEFLDECAPSKETMRKYLFDLKELKKKYEHKIKINIGSEIDYLDSYESKTKEILDEFGPYLEDGLLSVHFIKIGEEFTDVDGLNGFEKAIEILGSVEKVYDKYYETLLIAVTSDLGKYKPKRIGHPNLIRIFNKLYPIDYKNNELLDNIAIEIKKRNYEVDVNTAGLRKQYCGEIYVSGFFKDLVEKYHIKKVYGADAHTAADVGKDFL